jgi:hypothetical protein
MTQPPRDEPFVPRRPLSSSADEDTQVSFTNKVGAAMSNAGQALGAAAAATAEAARQSAKSPVAAPASREGGVKIRRARLRLIHIDPWSVMKMAFLLSIAIGVVTVIAVGVVWTLIGATGIWDSINSTVGEMLSSDSGSTFDIRDYVGTGRIVGFTMLVSVVNVVLLTAIATLGSFLYNMAADLLGGVEVTLAEER